jgi:hypothetical protein
MDDGVTLAPNVIQFRGRSSVRLLHGTTIEDLTIAALNETFRLPVETADWSGERRNPAHCAHSGAAEGTIDGLCKYCASLVIENRYRYLFILLAH